MASQTQRDLELIKNRLAAINIDIDLTDTRLKNFQSDINEIKDAIARIEARV